MSLDLHRRQDLRSLALHRKAVRVLKKHPEKAARALQVLERWQAKRDAHCSPLWDEWKRIIEGRLWKIAVEDGDRGQQIRQQALCASYWNQRYATQSFVDGSAVPSHAENSVSALFLAVRCFPSSHRRLKWK